jgi:hypothetical protein
MRTAQVLSNSKGIQRLPLRMLTKLLQQLCMVLNSAVEHASIACCYCIAECHAYELAMTLVLLLGHYYSQL